MPGALLPSRPGGRARASLTSLPAQNLEVACGLSPAEPEAVFDRAVRMMATRCLKAKPPANVCAACSLCPRSGRLSDLLSLPDDRFFSPLEPRQGPKFSLVDPLGLCSRSSRAPLATARSAEEARTAQAAGCKAFTSIVRCRIKSSRTLCSINTLCCSRLFTGTSASWAAPPLRKPRHPSHHSSADSRLA